MAMGKGESRGLRKSECRRLHGSVAVLAAVLCVLGIVDAKTCVPPLEGEWTMMHQFPDPESEDGFIFGARSNYTLTNPQERVYLGTFQPDSVLSVD